MKAKKSVSVNQIVTEIHVKVTKRDLIKIFGVIVLAQAFASWPVQRRKHTIRRRWMEEQSEEQTP